MIGYDIIQPVDRGLALINENGKALGSMDETSGRRDIEKVDGRRLRGEKRKQAILEAAREVFIENGYRKTTLDAILAKAGGSRQTIYQTFGGKSGLLSAIIKMAEDDFIASLPAIHSHDHNARDTLTQFGLRLIAIWQSVEGSAINRMIITEGLESAELMAAWFESGPRPSLAELAQFLHAEDVRGNLVVKNASQTAQQYMFLLIGILAYPKMAGQPIGDVRPHIDAAVDLILAGCGSARPETTVA